jgi:hypothetical protein
MAYCNETQWQMYAQIYLDALDSRFAPFEGSRKIANDHSHITTFGELIIFLINKVNSECVINQIRPRFFL